MPTNYETQFSSRPAVYQAWGALREAISAGMEPRRYELATFAAAQAIKSSYCSLAHGMLLRDTLGGWEPHDETERAVMALAEQVALDATKANDGMGVLPDAHYNELDAEVRAALVVGRPIASS